MIEFVLVAVPMLFIIMSTVEMARCMWSYHSLANAVRCAARYAVVHGADCSAGGNSCSATVAQVVSTFLSGGTGLPTTSTALTLTLTSSSGSISCNPVSSCIANNSTWPPAAAATPGSSITISATYHFSSAWSMIAPGNRVAGLLTSPTLSATSMQAVQF